MTTPAKAQPQQDEEEEAVLVCVRVRPQGGADGELGWTVDDATITQAAGKHEGERYTFDSVCGTHVHTEQVYERSCREVVGGLLVGRSGTIVAYGQTASGKTHTTQGIMRLACEQVFDENDGVRVWASYLEVYDEKLTDLLDGRSSVQVKDKPVVRVTGAHEVRVASPNALDAIVSRGERNRKRGATRLNAKSSRSHAALRLRVETDVRGVRFEATLCVVDLAGSERPQKTRKRDSQNGQRAWVSAPETRFNEGVGINKSLSALSHVLRQMGDRLKPSFRNSTLTRLLQPTLQGRAKLALICCVAPGTIQLEETRRTLQFGRRAARATIRLAPNTVVSRKADPEAALRAERLERENLQLARAVAAQAATLEEKALRIKTLERLALTMGDAGAVAQLKRRRRRTMGNITSEERERPPRASLDAVGALYRRAEAAEAAFEARCGEASRAAAAEKRCAEAEAALEASVRFGDRCATAEAGRRDALQRVERAEAETKAHAKRAEAAEAALAASRGAARDAAQAAAALADDAAGFTERVTTIVDSARDACADGLVEGALNAARLSLAREGYDVADAVALAVEEADARSAAALEAAKQDALLRRQSSVAHKTEAKGLRQTVRDLKGTISTQKAYIRGNDDVDDLTLQLKKVQRDLAGAERKARRVEELELRVADLQNELAAQSRSPVITLDATRASLCPPPLPPRLPPRPAPAPQVSDFDAELLGACRRHAVTGRWRVVARRLKLWRVIQTAHALREHCDAPTPLASPAAAAPAPLLSAWASPAPTEEPPRALASPAPTEEPSPAPTEQEPSPTPTEPSQGLSLSAWAASPQLPRTPPADAAGAVNMLDAWAARTSPAVAPIVETMALGAWASPPPPPSSTTSSTAQMALGAWASPPPPAASPPQRRLESPGSTSERRSPLAAFMAKMPNPTSPTLLPRKSPAKSASKLAAFVAAVPNPASPRMSPAAPLSSRLQSSAGANRSKARRRSPARKTSKSAGRPGRAPTTAGRQNSPPPRRSPRFQPSL